MAKKVVPDEEVGYDFMLSMFRGVFFPHVTNFFGNPAY